MCIQPSYYSYFDYTLDSGKGPEKQIKPPSNKSSLGSDMSSGKHDPTAKVSGDDSASAINNEIKLAKPESEKIAEEPCCVEMGDTLEGMLQKRKANFFEGTLKV